MGMNARSLLVWEEERGSIRNCSAETSLKSRAVVGTGGGGMGEHGKIKRRTNFAKRGMSKELSYTATTGITRCVWGESSLHRGWTRTRSIVWKHGL